jgi:hypothetical protein
MHFSEPISPDRQGPVGIRSPVNYHDLLAFHRARMREKGLPERLKRFHTAQTAILRRKLASSPSRPWNWQEFCQKAKSL